MTAGPATTDARRPDDASARTVLLRGPGTDARKPPPRLARPAPALSRRAALYVFAAAGRVPSPEAFGLGAAVVARGPSVFCGALIVPDDLAATDPGALRRMRRWATAHPLDTAAGPAAWQVATLSEFYDPRATAEKEPAAPWAFAPNAYTGATPVVGADLGRVFGLAAEHCTVRNGAHRDGWEIWLPGWGRQHSDGAWKRRSPNRPALRLSARRVGWQVDFGPCEKGFGKRVDGRVWRGSFLDVVSLAYALDADRGASFAEHAAAFGIGADPLPAAVALDADGAGQVTTALDSIRRLALALDDEAGRLFTTSEDRRRDLRRIDLTRLSSPGAIAADVFARLVLRPPADTFGLTGDEDQHWAEAFHGGRCDLDRRLAGVPFPAACADVGSCYPLVAHRIGWWALMRAEQVTRRGVARQLRALCRRAAQDPAVLVDSAVWERFGVTLVEVAPAGERFVVSVDDDLRPDGRTEVVPVYSQGRTVFYSALDVLAAAVLSGRVPEILSAVQYVPGEPQKTRRRVPFTDGLMLDADADPVVTIVRSRRRAKQRGDRRQAAELRVVANSLVYGVPSRFDNTWRPKGRDEWVRGERPGPWNCLPIGSSVAAGARLILAIAERMIADRGGTLAYCDTDSLIVPVTPDGGPLVLADGSTVGTLSPVGVGNVVDAFAPLAVVDDWPVWGVEPPACTVVFAPKRHASEGPDGGGLVGMTEATLGSVYVDPPAMPGHGPDGRYRRWSEAAVARAVAFSEAKAAGEELALPVPWDDGNGEPFPAFRRFQVRTPKQAKELAVLGARPGTRYVAADRRWKDEGRVPVVLDPGGDLAGWADLPWVDKRSGEPLHISIGTDEDAVIVDSLGDKAQDYGRPTRTALIESVTITRYNVGYRGRVSGIYDADAADLPGDLRSYRPIYAGRCPVCDEPVGRRGDALWCSDRCGWTARKRRGRGTPTKPRPCGREGCAGVVERASGRFCSKQCRDRAYLTFRTSRPPLRPPPLGPFDAAELSLVHLGQ